MTSTQQISCRYTVLSGGDAEWIRNVSIPLCEALEQGVKEDGLFQFADERPDFLKLDSRPKADGSILIGGAVGLLAFFASWMASKILDDIYEAKFQPAVKKALGSADKKLSGANSTKSKILQLGIYYADKNVFILIGLVGDTFDEILACEHLITTVHRNAIKWVEKNGVGQSVHLYLINRGNVNLEPQLFENLTLAHNHIHRLEQRKTET